MERGSLLLPACEVNEEEGRDGGGGGGLKRTVQGRSSLRRATWGDINWRGWETARIRIESNTDESREIEGGRKKKGLELKGLTNTAASLLFFFLDNFFVALPRFYLSNCSVFDAILTLPLPPPNSFHHGFVRFTSNNTRGKMFEESQGGGRLSNRG